MKRWKKIVLVLLGVIILSQLPFLYRRYQLSRLKAAIRALDSQRIADHSDKSYADYKGVIHVHSMLGGHSTGNFTDIIQAASANQLNFLVMTEHPARDIDTAEMTLKGFHKGVLFINGSEISAANGDRLLLLPGDGSANASGSTTTQELASQAKASGHLAFIAYPQEFRSWEINGCNGIEIYNLYTNTKKINPLLTFFDGLWSYWSYPDLLFTTFYERPSDNLKKWDDLMRTANRKLVAIAGNDAHANIGVYLGDATGKKLLQVQLDPYERSFSVVRTHALIEKAQSLNTDTLLNAIASGHCYISFDLLCDATGFSYTAENGAEKKLMGDEIELGDGVRLTVTTPVKSRILLIRDGEVIRDEDGTPRKEFFVNQKGIYRIEAYLSQLPKPVADKPWIISNPIYIK